jgi:hypothetical protein
MSSMGAVGRAVRLLEYQEPAWEARRDMFVVNLRLCGARSVCWVYMHCDKRLGRNQDCRSWNDRSHLEVRADTSKTVAFAILRTGDACLG